MFKTSSKYIKNTINIALLGTTILCSTLSLATERVEKITIQGNKRIEKSTIENYLGLKIGDEYNLSKENDATKSLYATELFENVKIHFANGNLLVTVDEPAFVSKIQFKGNSKIKQSTLSAQMLTTVGESLSKAYIKSDVEKIKEMYKRSGRFSVSVEPVIEEQPNGRVKVIFQIGEGPKTTIRNIHFSGNSYYRPGELRSIILTKESRWFRFLETNDTYDPDRIEYDKEVLKDFYQSVGFADFTVLSATVELSKTKEFFTVTYSIDEGDKYSLGEVEIDNKIAEIDTKLLTKFIQVKTGNVFNMKLLEQVAEKITAFLGSKGYPQIAVYPDISRRSKGVVHVKFVIDNADKVFIERINIKGNVKTHEKVIRREMRIEEGDIFNRAYIEASERNIRNLDYFDKLSMRVSPTNKKDKYNIDLNVTEKSTASLGLDVGYNTAGGVFTRLSFLERNLVGTGKYLNAGVQAAKKSTNYYMGLTEPYFLDRDLSLSGNVFKNHTGRSGGFGEAEQTYTLKSLGAKTSLGYEIAPDITHDIDYLIKKDVLSAPEQGSSRFLVEQMGKFTTSAISQTFTYDQTDSRIIPKNGYLVSGTQEYAGLGGDAKYLKHEVEAKYFYSFNQNKVTLKLSGTAGDIRGVGNNAVRISDRFNLGDYSLRGFTFGGIGPRDKKSKEGLGGQEYYSISTELNFPLGLPEEFNLTGVAFADAGSVWGVKLSRKSQYKREEYYNDRSLRASTGVGLIWITRIAPIRVDWAIPIKRKKYDDVQHFHMKFSTHF